MKYIEHNFTITFIPHSLRIRYQPSEDTVMIDISAIQSLEIMQNQRKPKSKDCLFGLLNHTVTPMGSRMLRSNILQPPTRHDTFIHPRYEALDELTANEEMFREIRKGIFACFYSTGSRMLRRNSTQTLPGRREAPHKGMWLVTGHGVS